LSTCLTVIIDTVHTTQVKEPLQVSNI